MNILEKHLLYLVNMIGIGSITKYKFAVNLPVIENKVAMRIAAMG